MGSSVSFLFVDDQIIEKQKLRRESNLCLHNDLITDVRSSRIETIFGSKVSKVSDSPVSHEQDVVGGLQKFHATPNCGLSVASIANDILNPFQCRIRMNYSNSIDTVVFLDAVILEVWTID